jgi:hypothetical protein
MMNILNFLFSLLLPSNAEVCFDYAYYEEGFVDYVPGTVCIEVENEDILSAMHQCQVELEISYFKPEYLIMSNCYVD